LSYIRPQDDTRVLSLSVTDEQGPCGNVATQGWENIDIPGAGSVLIMRVRTLPGCTAARRHSPTTARLNFQFPPNSRLAQVSDERVVLVEALE
jgi:hypothetical protein